MFSNVTPYATTAADQPIFQMETRRLEWAGDKRTLTAFSLRRIARIAAYSIAIVISVFAAIYIVSQLAAVANGTAYSESLLTSIVNAGFSGSAILAALGLMMSFQVDFLSIAASINSINGDVLGGRWDLYKLAGVRAGYFTIGKHGVAQMRVWRTVMTVIGVRAAAILLFLASNLVSILMTVPDYFQYDLSMDTLFLQLFIGLILAGIPGWFFLFEPILRLRTMTAVGLMISAHVRSPSMSPLAAFGFTAGLWIMQLAIFGAVGCGTSALLFPLLLYGTGAVCGLPVLFGLLIAAMYAYYDVLKNFSLRRAAFRLASLESNS